ncbi:hypothetical protein [Rhizosaccharibacter radicis]|uniref:Uncharacterized protein n=1 Tax=Rhizosaccharibacter radicis TaxID=2782605 RepID=A0ABT1VVS8_9PROT|nr:hypothetical protein [Acetobacteraceae bacterium KSS12]
MKHADADADADDGDEGDVVAPRALLVPIEARHTAFMAGPNGTPSVRR